MSLDRSLGVGVGMFMTMMLAALSVVQAGLGLLQSGGGPATRLPPHRDPGSVRKYTDKSLAGLRDVEDEPADIIIALVAASATVAPQGQNQGVPGQAVPRPATEAEVAAVDAFYKALLAEKSFDINNPKYQGKPYTAELTEFARKIQLRDNISTARLKRAGAFFRRHLFRIMVILSTSSLLEAYACANGVQVLASTGYLSKETNRRLKETLQFVLYVNEPDAFDARDGKGLAAIRKVRLMHAAIRWLIRERARNKWKGAWGKQINGEDLLGMLMGFSVVVLRDLAELNVALTGEEVDDHIYLWNEVGRLLGAQREWLPADLGEALALMAAIKSRQQEYSPEGAAMTTALLDYHKAVLGDLVPVATGAMRRLAGDYICDMLGVPESEYADRSWRHDFVFRVLLWWGDKLITRDKLEVTDEYGAVQTYGAYDIPKSLRSVVYPETYS
jgi:hypothetical protein